MRAKLWAKQEEMSTFRPCLDLGARHGPRPVHESKPLSKAVEQEPRAVCQSPATPKAVEPVFYWHRQTAQSRKAAKANRYWYDVRDGIENELGLNKQIARKQSGASCIVGFLCQGDELTPLDDMSMVLEGHEVLIRVVPKQAVSPPKRRKVEEPKDNSSISEEDRILAMQAGPQKPEPYWASLPVDRIGDAPPEWYVCKNCSHRGHYIRQCPWKAPEKQELVRQKRAQRPCGIPRCYLRLATEQEKADGKVFVGDDGKLYSTNHALT